MNWSHRVIPIDEITPWEQNPRTMSKAQAEALQGSIEKFGLCQPLILNSDHVIIGGHQRYETLKKLGHKQVDAFVANNHLAENELRELAVRLNKISGDFDFDSLANLFDSDELLDLGFDETELDLDPPEKAKPKAKPTITITFDREDDAHEVQPRIEELIAEYAGAYCKMKR